MEKKEFFKEPGYNAIIKDKTRIIKPGKLVTIIEKLRDNEYYRIDHNIIPLKSEKGISYLGKEDPRKELGQRFLKRGPLIELNFNRMTLEQAMKAGKKPLDLRRKFFDDLELTEHEMAGYGFWGIRDRRHRRTNLVSCIKGARAFAYFQYSQKKGSDLIRLLEYDLEKEDEYLGADVLIEVPSETEIHSPYPITLRSVPIKNIKEKYGVVYDFDADHTCRFKASRITERHTSRENFLDFHIVMANLAFIDYELTIKKNKIPLEMCLFVIPTQNLVNFYRKLTYNTVVKYKECEEEVERATNQAEREILLWHKVKKDGHDATCFATQKLKNYRWK